MVDVKSSKRALSCKLDWRALFEPLAAIVAVRLEKQYASLENDVVRVIYRWRVQEGGEGSFRAAWEKATSGIRESTDGARGSVLLQSREDSAVFVTIARWDTIEQWQAFWNNPSRTEMQEMHALAERLSAEAFDEIGDYTV